MTNVIIITGGSRGIGAACARLASEQGFAVCLSYVSNKGAAEEIVAQIEASGGTAKAVQADVANESDILKLFEVADEMGTLKSLINNAGIVDKTQRVEDYSSQRLQRMYSVNVIGSILCAREAVKAHVD